MLRYLKIFLLTLSINLCSSSIFDLDGTWTATSSDSTVVIDGTVPGGIYSDLMNSQKIDDIFYGNGDDDFRWVGSSNWTYTKTVNVDEALLASQTVNLVFEGLDTFATIYINGQEVGKSQNMFVRYVFNVKNFLKVGDNEIRVQFASPIEVAAALADSSVNSYVVPPECPDPKYNGICHANRIRKMQASFSWDWGPAFPSVGIWKSAFIEGFDVAVIDYVLAQPSRNADNDGWVLPVTTYFRAGDKTSVTGTIDVTLETEGDPVTINTQVDATSNEFNEISSTVVLELSDTQVNWWWPNGYYTRPRYSLKVTFNSGADTDTKNILIAFRTIELLQESIGDGLSFMFKVNGYPIFAKGANEIPLSVLPERGTSIETARKVLETVRDTNMNMLRVWGGGVYESDEFYDLADEYGIMIWQDFMFACAMYPTDANFLSNVAEEVRHQIKRLASHPSIILWAGNNENESALKDNWYGTGNNFDLYKSDYIKLYVDTIRAEVLRILPSAIFITSSPSDGLESERQGYVASYPSDPRFGDVHFYDYNGDSWSVSTFPIPRFCSEYGYQSLPSFDTWMTVTSNVDDLNPTSSFMEHRQHHPDGNQQNTNLIQLQLQLPQNSGENYVKAYIFYSQIVQAQSIKAETEHYRSYKGRLNSQNQGNTMGALYWQLNDVWVAPTWSGMDFTGKWKMLQYFSKDFFATNIVTGNINNNNELELYAITDLLEAPTDVSLHVMVHIYKWDSFEPLSTTKYEVTLDPLKAVPIAPINVQSTLQQVGCGDDYNVAKTSCFFHLHLMDEAMNNLAPFNYVFPEKLKNSLVQNANVQITSVTAVDDQGLEFEITVTSDTIALFVWLDSPGIPGRFSQNGFMQVNPTWTVSFTAEQQTTADQLTQILTVTHLRDSIYL